MSATQTPPPPATMQGWYATQANTLFVLCAIAALSFPGAIAGALLTAALWHATETPLYRRVLLAALGVLTALSLRTVMPGWLLRIVFTAVLSGAQPASLRDLWVHGATDALLGPALLLTVQLAQMFRARTLLGQVEHEHRHTMNRSRAMTLGYRGSRLHPWRRDDWEHPPGKIRLGSDEFGRPFDFDIVEILQHVLMAGATGVGKTVTAMRIAAGALANGFGVIIADCKGVVLARDASELAERFGLPFNLVDPHEPDSMGYDPCTGDAAHVTNKLIGAFSFAPEGEIYKNIAMEVVPVIVRALVATGQRVTLQRISEALMKGGLARLGRTPGAESLRERLDGLEAGAGVETEGYKGLRHRLGALSEGRFGEVFAKQPAVDWAATTAAPSVTYFSLSVMDASEDVELFGRVIAQDLKQLCDSRLRALRSGATLTPFLVIFDEFAALREARQLVDLLLQAREAQIAVVVGTQFLPVDIPIRTPLLQAGVLICHRIASQDAMAIADELGTHRTQKLTTQIEFDTGDAPLGSVREVDEYNIHPNILRELPIGMTAVYARRSKRRQVVRIHLDQT